MESGVTGPESPPVPLTWGSLDICLPSGEGNYGFIPIRNNFFSSKQSRKTGYRLWFHEKVIFFFFFFYSRHFRFYLKFGYSEMESYFKRAKTRQAPENGEISSMVPFLKLFFMFFLEAQFSPKLPQCRILPLPQRCSRSIILVPKCHFPPQSLTQLMPWVYS